MTLNPKERVLTFIDVGSFIVLATVAVLNITTEYIIKFFARFEKPHTYSNELISIAKKMWLVRYPIRTGF